MIYYKNGVFVSTRHYKVNKDYIYYPKNRNISKFITYHLFKLFFRFKRFNAGFKIVGKENIDKVKDRGNCVIISNHVFGSDAFEICSFLRYKNYYVTSLIENFSFGPISWLIRLGGGVPIPPTIQEFKEFSKQTISTLKEGNNIVFFPEGDITSYNLEIKEFKKGAFKFAFNANSYMLPCIFTFRKVTGFRKLFRRKPLVTLNVLEPIKYSEEELKNSNSIDLMKDRFESMYKEFQKKHNNV